MTDQPTVPLRELLEQQHDQLLKELSEVKALQQATNGRLQRAELAIAVLKDQADRTGMHAAGGLLAGMVSGLGLLAAAVWRVIDR